MDDLKDQIPRNERKVCAFECITRFKFYSELFSIQSSSQPHVDPQGEGMELDEEPEAVIVEVEEEMDYLPALTKSPGVSSDEAYIGFVESLMKPLA